MSEVFIPPDLQEHMTPAQRREYLKLLEAQKAMRSPLDYALYVNPKAKRHRHSEYLNDVLLALEEGRLYKTGPGPAPVVVDITEQEPLGRRIHPETGEETVTQLMISLPPRIGKSWMVGEHFPAWYLTRHPDEQIMYISHGQSLAASLSGLARDHIMEHPELGVSAHAKHQAEAEWSLDGQNAMTSGMIAKGSDGVPTGRGGNLIIDDIFQKGSDVLNDETRKKVHEHYNSSLRPRVNYPCWKILMGTRWHEDDLHGYLLEQEPEKWYVVNIPALAFDEMGDDGISIDPETGERDVFSRRPGEAVCPEIAPVSYYKAAQRADPFWFDAEYMGRPSGISGSLFSVFPLYRKHTRDDNLTYELFTDGQVAYVQEKDCVRFATVDMAVTSKQTSDWTVAGIWDLDPWRRLILREVIRTRITGGKEREFLADLYNTWNLDVLGIEQSTYDYRMVQDMLLDGSMNIWPFKPDKDKFTRAIPAANLLNLYHMFADRDAEWLPAWRSELSKFPRDKYDDQVDMTAYASRMRDLLASRPVPQHASKEYQGLTDLQIRLIEATKVRPTPKSNGMVIS